MGTRGKLKAGRQRDVFQVLVAPACNHRYPYKKKNRSILIQTHKEEATQREGGNMITDAMTGLMQQQGKTNKRKSQKMWTAFRTGRDKKQILPQCSEGAYPANNLVSDLWSQNCERKYTAIVLRHQVCSSSCVSPGKLIQFSKDKLIQYKKCSDNIIKISADLKKKIVTIGLVFISRYKASIN